MLGSQLPSWKQMIGLQKPYKTSYWKDESIIWTSQSAVSVRLIVEEYKKYHEKLHTILWIPDFFCEETKRILENDNLKIVFYPITYDLEPDWNIIREMSKGETVHLFLFVHYFGVYRDVNRAKNFCRQHKALLIEDCAHCLFDYEKIGKKGDFILFSPHKILPIENGSILTYNESDGDVKAIGEKISERVSCENDKSSSLKWRIKKGIQKITRLRKTTRFRVEAHYGTEYLGDKHPKRLSIGDWSKEMLKSYGYETLKKIAFIRRQNLQAMNYVVSNLVPGIKCMIGADTFCPYTAVYSLEDVTDKQGAVRKLEERGILVSYWPDLSPDIQGVPFRSIAPSLSLNLIVIPIHQGLNAQSIIKKFGDPPDKRKGEYQLIPLSRKNRELWDNPEYVLDNIPQDYDYGQVKSQISGDLCSNFLIYTNGKCIGKIQALIRKKAGIRYLIRINRGPVMMEEYNRADVVFEIMKQLKRQFGIIPVLWAPNLEFTPYHLHLAISYGWNCWNLIGYPSGEISLKKSREEIRQALDSKWRNQLVSAEKNDLKVKNDSSRYKELLALYLQDQKEKGYGGVPEDVLKLLYTQEDSPLETYYIVNSEDQILAFDIIYRQKEAGHYLVGWNSYEGRKLYLNNLLLFNIALSLKEKGLERFDLGGIEYLYTEEIAKFKDGMKPVHYQLLGELIK